MKTMNRLALRTTPSFAIAIQTLVAAFLLAACGRDDTRKLKTQPIAGETAPVPAAQSQLDMTPPPPSQPPSTGVVQAPAPQPIVTNSPPPLMIASTNTAQPGTKEYTVVKGDTLVKIARAHGVRFTALSNANRNVNLSKLVVGQKLHIPTSASASATAIGYREPGSGGDSSASGNVHVVKAGETLTRIAKDNHTTVKAIQAANGLKTTRVLVGQKLRLPPAGQPTAPAATSNPPAPIQAVAAQPN
jgi:LysM repeat protein